MHTSIEIDFDVFKELTILRETPETTENDVIRSLLGLEPKEPSSPGTNGGTHAPTGDSWVWKGAIFPHGTKLRAEHGGHTHHAEVENGALVYDGERYKSPSAAASAATGNSTNGWIFWECKRPGDNGWVLINKLRND